jgi:nitric oxide dioxygenase
MSPEQIALVRESFAKVLPSAELAAEVFYWRLFSVAPDVRSLFPSDMKTQGRALMGMLAQAVASLDRLDEILPAVEASGRRHMAYGAKPEHYPIVGECLLWTLAATLGDAFTPAVRDAWATTYDALSRTMIGAAEIA